MRGILLGWEEELMGSSRCERRVGFGRVGEVGGVPNYAYERQPSVRYSFACLRSSADAYASQ